MGALADRAGAIQPERRLRNGGAPKVRHAVFEDYDRIAALQVRNGLSARSREDWVALWKGNPVYEAWGHDWPIGWVLEADGGEIVGSIGNLPLLYRFRGRELLAGTSYGWAVDPEYRSYSLQILGRFLKQNAIDLFVFTTVGPRAEPAYQALQLSRAPVGDWSRSGFWVIDSRRFLKTVMSRGTLRLPRILTVPASAVLAGWEMAHEIRIPHATSHQKGSAAIELCDGFDSRFDVFWDALKRENPYALLAVRSRETLEWHFRKTPQRPCTWILGFRQGTGLCAYAIFDRLDSVDGLKRVRFVDFQALRGAEHALGAALRWMLARCREEDMHVLEVMGRWVERPDWPRTPVPYQRRLPSWVYYYKCRPELAQELGNPSVWTPTVFDGDASL